MNNQRMIRAYFDQGAQYYSASKEEFQDIATMHPRHAANAARKLLSDACRWAKDAGVDQDRHSRFAEFPHLWLSRTALYNALAARAGF